MTTQKFVPLIDTSNIIREVDVDEILKLTEDHYKIDGSPNLQQYLGHTVNLGNPRYHRFANERRCQCCDIAITHAFLEYDPDNKGEDGNPLVHINFYAETKDKPNADVTHLVLMTDSKPHQATTCVSCGWASDALNCSLFELKRALFNCYRIYRSSLTLHLSDEVLKPAYSELNKNRKLIDNVTQGLAKARPEAHEPMRKKIAEAQARIAELEPKIEAARIHAQQNGVPVSESQVKLM